MRVQQLPKGCVLLQCVLQDWCLPCRTTTKPREMVKRGSNADQRAHCRALDILPILRCFVIKLVIITCSIGNLSLFVKN